MNKRLLLSAVIVWLAGQLTAGAVTQSPKNEYELLQALPPGLMPSLLVSEPDDAGLIGYQKQQGRWFQAGMQRGGARHLLGGVLAGDIARMERGWLSVDATFARQRDDGGFLVVHKPYDKAPLTFDQEVETTYFYLQALAHALLVLQESPHAERYRERVEMLKPKIRRAADFVMSGREGIVPAVGHTANRLLIAAKALGLCGVLLEEEAYKAEARRLVDVALRLRDADGVFIERGGRDSSYNAVALLMAQVITLYLPDPKIDRAMREAMAWQLTRITPEGEVLIAGNTRTGTGREKSRGEGIKKVNTREVAVALLYHGLMYDNAEALRLGQAVAARRNQGEE